MGCALPLVLGGGWLLLRPEARARTLRTLAAVRVQVVLVGAFGILLFGPILGPQAADVILRWVDEPGDGLVGGAATLVFAAVLWLSCRWLVLLILSSTSVRDGCRISVSRLDGDDPGTPCVAAARDVAALQPVFAATEDAFDVCAGHDLRLSVASPQQCGVKPAPTPRRQPRTVPT